MNIEQVTKLYGVGVSLMRKLCSLSDVGEAASETTS